MRGLDPEEEDNNPVVPNDSQSSDQSKSKLRAAWDAWTSRPENNAALLQTGLALLQPRAPGQSAVGQFANAVGQGAEASDRNLQSQKAEEKLAEEQDIKRREAGARETTAGAYAEQVKQGGKDKTGKTDKGALQTQMAFQKWLRTPEGIAGEVDPVLSAIQKSFPDVKNKGDLLANPQARQAAFNLYKVNFPEPGDEGEAPTSPSPAAQPQGGPPVGAPGPKIVYDKIGKPYQWDGVPGHAPVPMGQ